MTESTKNGFGIAAVCGIVVMLVFGIIFGSIAGCGTIKNFHRSQKRQDAENNVKITHIKIRQTNQQVQIVRAQINITKAEAEKRYQESIGIKRSQDEIAKTLTPAYLQHEAIQAQRAHTGAATVYIPSGNQGIPLVATTPPTR